MVRLIYEVTIRGESIYQKIKNFGSKQTDPKASVQYNFSQTFRFGTARSEIGLYRTEIFAFSE